MVDFRDSKSKGGGWSPHFIRSFNDWEIEEVESVLHTIQPMKVIPNLEDKLLLNENKANDFSIKLMYTL